MFEIIFNQIITHGWFIIEIWRDGEKNHNYKTKILNEESVRVYEASVAFLTTFLLFISLSQSWFPGNSNHHQPPLNTQGNLSCNQPEWFIVIEGTENRCFVLFN